MCQDPPRARDDMIPYYFIHLLGLSMVLMLQDCEWPAFE